MERPLEVCPPEENSEVPDELAARLRSFGLPDERHEEYLRELRRMVAVALDAYFATLHDPNR